MAGRGAGLLGQIHRLWDLGTFAGLTDAQLLARFADRREDGAELAFEALVERHGPMVFRVCRGVLRDEHAAEDAFQATFLVLARKARSLWVNDSLASWLHGVAHRVAARARVRRRPTPPARAPADGGPRPGARGPARSSPVRGLGDSLRGDRPAARDVPRAGRPLLPRGHVVPGRGDQPRRKRGHRAGPAGAVRERLRKNLVRRGVEVPAIVATARPAIPAVVVRHGLVQATARAAVGLSTARDGELPCDFSIGDLLV